MPALLDDLRRIVGAPHLLTEGDLSAYERDWRRRYHGRSLAVALLSASAGHHAHARAVAGSAKPLP